VDVLMVPGCGDQLRLSIHRLIEAEGVLLHLSQEGRGTCLANRLRACRLHDAESDTIDAERQLSYSAADVAEDRGCPPVAASPTSCWRP
jgi:GTP cyclohydrolase II